VRERAIETEGKMRNKPTEIAYSTSRFLRVLQTGYSFFEVQSLKLRGEHKHGAGKFIWTTLYGVYDRQKAIGLLEGYVS
jgi:hypothetical protein